MMTITVAGVGVVVVAVGLGGVGVVVLTGGDVVDVVAAAVLDLVVDGDVDLKRVVVDGGCGGDDEGR